MKPYHIFAGVSVALLCAAAVTEWYPKQQALPVMVAEEHKEKLSPKARARAKPDQWRNMIAERETMSQVPKKLYSSVAPITAPEPTIKTEPTHTPWHKTEIFEFFEKWFTLFAEFLKTVGGVSSGVLSLILWRRSSKEKRA